jgi:hypothetical protein
LRGQSESAARWRKEVREHAVKAFPGLGIKRAEEERVAQLERKVGQPALEIDFCGDAGSMPPAKFSKFAVLIARCPAPLVHGKPCPRPRSQSRR